MDFSESAKKVSAMNISSKEDITSGVEEPQGLLKDRVIVYM